MLMLSLQFDSQSSNVNALKQLVFISYWTRLAFKK